MKKFTYIFLALLFIALPFRFVEANTQVKDYKVLILNSYHEGYTWSDNIVEAIRIEFAKEIHNFDITVEYLDTRNNPTEEYIESLNSFLISKYSGKEYDVIIASDDAAFRFMQEYGNDVFPSIPYVFCGVNYFDDSIVRDNYTGIVESYNLEGTIDLAITINPKLKNVYLINDKSTTGLAVQKNIDESIPKFKNVNFIMVDSLDVNEVEKIISNLDDDSIVFFAAYFIDEQGNKIDFEQSLQRFSEVSSVPIYGMWDFYLNHGIVGGSLTSGYYQGSMAAQYALEILYGANPNDIPIEDSLDSNFKFDYTHLTKHNIDVSKVPSNSVVINMVYKESKQILVLHSYHSQMKWVQGIEDGLESQLSEERYELIYDYMDSKRVADPSYIKEVYDQMTIKHSKSTYDLIVVSDNNAFNFVQKFGDSIFGDIPIVFCGVNHIEQYEGDIADNITGVVEQIDIEATIDLALSQIAGLSKIYVINDYTSTGVSNQEKMVEVEKSYNQLEFKYLRDYNMSNLLKKVANLDNDSAILLLSFNRDKSNSIFTYEEAGRYISDSANRPVYVTWDFYLDTGVVGGKVSSGFSQGYQAATMAKEILEGAKPSDIPIHYDSPNEYIVDYNAMKRFNLSVSDLPDNTRLMNQERTVLERYFPYIVLVGSFIIIILLIYLDSRQKVNESTSKAELMEQLNTYDLLSGAYTRYKGLKIAESFVEDPLSYPITVCFIDLDNLKKVNDNYGHDEGDELIVSAVNAFKIYLENQDIIMRYGGDEFVIVFVNMNKANAENVIFNINRHLDIVNKNRNSAISFSHGLSEHKIGSRFTDTINEADANMYLNKEVRKKELR